MKKLVLVFGLVMGSMLASDAIAAVNINGNTVEHNDGAKHRKRKTVKKHVAKVMLPLPQKGLF